MDAATFCSAGISMAPGPRRSRGVIEDSRPSRPSVVLKRRIDALIDEFFERRQRGEPVTPEAFAAEQPDLGDQLRPYLEGLSILDRLRPAAPAGDGGRAPGLPRFPQIHGYRMLEEIGRGGMGIAYKAFQVTTKREVAIKVLRSGPFATPSLRRRFEREVELAAKLCHPGIVRVLESGSVDEQPYYAMEYIDGTQLQDYLASAQPDLRDRVQLFRSICRAVHYAHQRGVIHRDLKPANVLIDRDGEPHILDFGLAKAADQSDADECSTTCLSFPGQILGTLFYLSPEQASGCRDEIDVRTDVYALGVMLFEAVTDSLPYDTSGSASHVLQRIMDHTMIAPSSLAPAIKGDLETIILKTLEKDRDRRYPSAADMAEDLRRFLDGEPILAKRASALYVLRKKAVKHKRAIVGGAAALLMVAVMLVIGGWMEHRSTAFARRQALKTQRALEAGAAVVAHARALERAHPEIAETWLVMAQAQYAGGQPEAALLSLARVVQHSPDRWDCRALLADMYRDSGRADRACELEREAPDKPPDTAEAWYVRSFATLDVRRALACAGEAVKRDPTHALAWIRIAYLRLQLGDFDGLPDVADRLVQLGEDPSEWTIFKGHVLRHQGRFRDAIEEYTLVVPDRPDARLHRAHTLRRIGRYEEGVADYTALLATSQGTQDVWHRYQRATPLWILGRREEAIEDYRQVRAQLGRPCYADARRYLILMELGRREEAAAIIDAALNDADEAWLSQIFRCLSGSQTPRELTAFAARNNLEQLCEAYYYAGEVCLLHRHVEQARRFFEQCVATGVRYDRDTQFDTPMNEFELAEWRLRSLDM